MLFSGKSFQNFCHLNVNMKLVTLTVILMSITFHHTHAQSCGSWKQAQSRAHCIGGSIGLTKRIVESFQNSRKASGDLEDSRQIETRQDYENSNEMTPTKAEYYRMLREMFENYMNNDKSWRSYEN